MSIFGKLKGLFASSSTSESDRLSASESTKYTLDSLRWSGDKLYELATTKEEYAKCVVGKKACAISTTYSAFIETHKVAGQAVNAAGGNTNRDYTIQKHVCVICEKCQFPLFSTTLGMLLISQAHTVDGRPLVLNARMKGGQCSKCGNERCCLAYDPAGFI